MDSPVRNEFSKCKISTPPAKKRLALCEKVTNDDTDEDVDTVSLQSHSSRKSLFTKEKMCDGYDPKINNFYQNFTFQVIKLVCRAKTIVARQQIMDINRTISWSNIYI